MAEDASGGKGDVGGKPADVADLSFEEALAELRQIVERLEKGEGRLDEAIDAYDRGARLKAHCERKLKEAESKIEKIRLGEDGVGVEPLDVDEPGR